MTIRVQDHLMLRGFEAVMSLGKSRVNNRLALDTLDGIDKLSKTIDRDNKHHMYDKYLHRNAGEFRMQGAKAIIESSAGATIKGPVTINIVETPKRKQAKAA